MARIPQRFKRVAEAFDEVAPMSNPCESSGSDHSPEDNLSDLSELVNSFIETGPGDGADDFVGSQSNCNDYYDANRGLKNVFENHDDDTAKACILATVEEALVVIGKSSSPDFKRRLMARLRYRGFDAGLCKSKWERSERCPAGRHEYIDVLMAGNRYIVEVYLAKEFEIARPTRCYAEILNHFPKIFVGKKDELKEIVRLMCKSMKKSMTTMDMPVPPWRRLAYVHAKWFSSYKRTTNEFAAVQKVANCDKNFGMLSQCNHFNEKVSRIIM